MIQRNIAGIISALSMSIVSAHAQSAAENDIRGPQDLINIPVTPSLLEKWQPLLYTCGGLLLIALALWFYLRMKRQPEVAISPADRALNELNHILRQAEATTADDYAARASEIIRSYIRAQFSISAPNQTTEEFLSGAKNHAQLAGHHALLEEFLQTSDVVKFAASGLSLDAKKQLHACGDRFVRETKQSNSTGGKS